MRDPVAGHLRAANTIALLSFALAPLSFFIHEGNSPSSLKLNFILSVVAECSILKSHVGLVVFTW